jgi:hypothetical protein
MQARRYGLGPTMNDGLPVACWCEKACKPMTPQQVRDGIGWSCGTGCNDKTEA